ncbi:hypothetical protein BB561_005371 [Smittium simulii]|uniref:Endoribonuclease YSH1 n=1 Tax=Smittium simulii TaxID=133385 RepID=A0A2T9YAN5_9FUNG|nr:hypothetical protein BB561_005371 [Smittium simulii]
MSFTKKRKGALEIPIEDEADLLKITPLGAGQEVGRSCVVIEYKNKTVMLDCGLHPAFDGLSSLPFLDEIDPTSVDVLLVTHFHVDHAAAVPYFLEKTNFSGRTFMTHPTKAIFRWLVTDYVRVSNHGNISEQDALYNEQDMIKAYSKIEVIDYHQQIEVNGIKFTAYNAGHVLGAAMFVIEIAGIRILYTGDYSREEDRHLKAAENPKENIDVMITESTYGVQSFEPRLEKEARFTKLVRDVVLRGGRCLMPVFALGRTQELLLILEEFWENHKELESIPIYFASTLAKRCMLVYQTYIHMMNSNIQKMFATSNPFIFKHISNLNSIAHFDDVGACVMIASPGMLQNGVSRDFFDRWAPDRRNGLVLTGYSVEGTLARTILSEPTEVLTQQGVKISRRMSINYISFSAHVDFTQNSQFIDEISPSNLILVHGEQSAMNRLKAALVSKFTEKEISMNIYTPKNTESVKMYFRGEKMARLMGEMAVEQVPQNKIIEGVLVQRNYKYNLYSSIDLKEFEGISEVPIKQTIKIPYHNTISLLLFHLQSMYGHIETSLKSGEILGDAVKINVFESVDLKYSKNNNEVNINWFSSTLNDMVADSVMALLLNIDCSPVSVKITSQPCGHSHNSAGCHGDNHTVKPNIVTEDESTNFKTENNTVVKDTSVDTELKLDNSSLKSEINLENDQDLKFLESKNVVAYPSYNYSRVSTELLRGELCELLLEHFNIVELSEDKQNINIYHNHGELVSVVINLETLDIINCDDDDTRKRILTLLARFCRTLKPMLG